jgi:hypothetical protein
LDRKHLSAGQTPQRREFGFPRFLASTSPHERIIERFHEERGPYNTDEEDDDAAEFSQLSRRHTVNEASGKATTSSTAMIHRSASMNDLANPDKSAAAGSASSASASSSHGGSSLLPQPNHRASTGGESHANLGFHRALSVEGSLNTSGKDNKENFAVPQDPLPVGAASGGGKKIQRQQSGPQSGRKILNSQNTKSS